MPNTVTSWFQGDEENELCPTLSFKHRVYAFICCIAFGFLLAVCSWLAVFRRNWPLFGVLLSASNITAIAGSCFLAGPLKQIKRMFEETRYIASGIFIVAVVCTVLAAVLLKSPPVVILFCILQYLAMIWYGLSYIPYARTVVKRCLGSILA